MKLNTLKLPPAVISSLYNKTLVATGNDHLPAQKKDTRAEAIENIIPPAEEKLNFLGENRKNILIAVNNKEVSFLPDDELSFLINMLTACKLSIADVAIVNLNKATDISYKKIFENLNSSIVLLLGSDPSTLNLPVSFPHFQVQSFNNYTFLFTPSLHEIQNDKILKSKLWVCLRRIFNV